MRTGDWALILGCSCGTGAAIAKALAEENGLNIVGVHRGNHPDSASEMQNYVEAQGKRCVLWKGDAGSAESIALLAEQMRESLGGQSIRFVVHSIAGGSFGRFASAEEDQLHPKQIEKTFQIMAGSFVYWVQALLEKRLLAPRARILGLTNPAGDSVVNGLGAISAAKAALDTYVRHLAMELGPSGYRINLLKFGLVETQAIKMAFTPERWLEFKARMAQITPARKICTVEEVARFVCVLESELADWFNGATIDFTGGQVQSAVDGMYNPKDEGVNVKYVKPRNLLVTPRA